MKTNSSFNTDRQNPTLCDRYHRQPLEELNSNSNKFLELISCWKKKLVKKKNQKNTSKYCSQNHLFSGNCCNEIILSHSGQEKIDNFASCLSLVNNDFIIF